ncbi:MAG: RNA polymerase sigma factor [Anaeromyxobacter sp.]|nr:RNA polymerase sigma factor [Anaeromyxobacter sp.]MBL0278639.1 RNA polymerase sigma factor [Anaeromyxobacter sp.]
MTTEEVSALYERFGYSVYRRCLRILREPARAEDALQDVFVRVLRYGSGYRGGSVLSWLLRIADRAALDRLHRDGGRSPADPEKAKAPELPTGLLQEPEAARLVSELLAGLPRPLQEVALLTYLDGLTAAEIATELGCSSMTVKRRLRALHEQARALVGERAEVHDVEEQA